MSSNTRNQYLAGIFGKVYGSVSEATTLLHRYPFAMIHAAIIGKVYGSVSEATTLLHRYPFAMIHAAIIGKVYGSVSEATTLLHRYPFAMIHAAIIVNIISISYGAFIGWTSASFVELQSAESPLESGPLSGSDAGWIGSMLCVGGLVGTVFFSWSADIIGRKRCLLLLALPGLLGWWIIPFATTPLHLSISRFLGGFSGGGSFSIIPIYTAELSEDKVRGTLGTFLVLCCNIGILLAFILGNFYSYGVVAWMLSLLPLIFLLCFVFVPESPQYLASKNNAKEAERSLCFFRNVQKKGTEPPHQIKMELENLLGKNGVSSSTSDDAKLSFEDFCEEKARKALIIGLGLMALNQFSGCFVMLNYTATIFQQSGSNLPPNVSAIIVGAIQLFGSYVSTLLVERAGRKILLIISAVGTGAGHLCLGGFILMGDTSTSAWIPVVSFSFIIFIACWGVLTLPFVVVAEIMPPKVRNPGCMICMLALWVFSFFMLKYMGLLTDVLGIHWMMFAFALFCFVGAVFIMFYVPETKGKPIEEILENL